MSFSAPTRERSAPALPLAGFVDILFLLLVFFLTASVFKDAERQIPIQLYDAESAELSTEAGTQLVVTTTEAGEIYLGPRQVTMGELETLLGDLAERFPDESLVLRGDVESNHGLNMRVLDIARLAGITDVQLAQSAPGGGGEGQDASATQP